MTTTARPTTLPAWTSGLPTQIAQPTPSLQASGFTAGQRPAYQTINALFYGLSQWVQYLDAQANGQVSGLEIGNSMRLSGGGTWSYSASASTLSWSDVFVLSTPSIPDSDNTIAAGSVSIAPGQLAYVVANLPFATTGNTTSGSTALTQLPYELGIVVGQTVTGQGIPGNTTVTAVADGQVTISSAATATASNVYLTFAGTTTPVVKVATGTSLMPSPNVIIIAACTSFGVLVGVNSGQMRLLDGEQKRLLGTGYIHTVVTQAGQALAAGTPVYISQGGGDTDNIQGTVTAGSSTMTGVSSTTYSMPGCSIGGTGLPSGTTVTAFGANSLSLSNAATSTFTGSFVQSRIPGAIYAADAGGFWGAIRGNVAGVVTTAPVISQTAASPVRFMTSGVFANYNGLTPGKVYYVNTGTPGALQTTPAAATAYSAPVGVALNATTLFVQPLAASRPPTADSNFNDVTLTPMAGSSLPVGFNINNASGNVLTADNAGNLTMQGALNVYGISNLTGLLTTSAGIASSAAVSAPSFVSAAGFKTVLPMATLSNGTAPVSSGNSSPLLDGSGQAWIWVAPFAGSIVALTGYNTGNASAQGGGTGVTYSVTYNNSEMALASSNAINAGAAVVTFPKNTYPFGPGSVFGLRIKSTGVAVNNVYAHCALVIEMGA